MSQQLQNDILVPLQELLARAALPVIVPRETSDFLSSSQKLATTTAHFAEASLNRSGLAPPRGAPHFQRPQAERLRQMLQDVADTVKHGPLRDAARTVTFTLSGLRFEFDDRGWVRYLGSEVLCTNRNFGEFCLLETIQALASELVLDFGGGSALPVPVRRFGGFIPTTQAFSDHRSEGLASVRLQYYKRLSSGALVLADPPEAKFEVIGGTPADNRWVPTDTPWTAQGEFETQLVAVTTSTDKLILLTFIKADPSDADIEEEIRKAFIDAASWRRISEADLPTDRSRRNDWFDDGKVISVRT